ncbi:MAG: metallophosphoesterase [Tannerella sp.]|jgi:endonuclease/exonuclease/phosphatase family metal-dependent hydrolase/UDP-2,3-diacylglucosamine pyrophosphatase LpxH|nr:metallophosphoesterase [Tannerella sp.]
MKTNIRFFYLWPVITWLAFSCTQEKDVELKVLQLNVWVNAARVEGGEKGLVDVIDRTDADVVLLCELYAGENETPLMQKVIDALAQRGKTYYGDGCNLPVGILSKYAPEEVSAFMPTPKEVCYRPVVKAHITVNGRTVAVYSTHLDHQNYAPYLSRGYSSVTWTKMDAPVTDPDSILIANRIAWRDETIRGFIRDARSETARGRLVIIGGDFNEPSHRDWQADTKDMRDHRGAVVPWDVSQMLEQAGYVDAWRRFFPNAVTHPGFTWPAGNEAARLNDLFAAPDADERDRIDFIYYYPQPGVALNDIRIVGPAASVDHGKITPEQTDDVILEPACTWPSDHKGNLATFRIAPQPDAAPPCPEKKLTFAFLTDIHLNKANGRDCYNGFKQALERAKSREPEFLVFGGDLVDINMGEQLSRKEADSMYTVFKQAVEQTGLPYYPAIGNHDRYFDAENGCPNGDEVFNAHLGGHSRYTFERQGVHFFVLNSVQHTDAGDLCIGAEQMEWLKRELVHVSLAVPVVVVQHVPVYSQYYPVVEAKFGSWDVVCNFKEELHLFREHNLKLVLQGHQHIHEEMWLQEVQYITGGAVCAGWWNGPFHGTEEGFLMVHVDAAGEFDREYVDYGWMAK